MLLVPLGRTDPLRHAMVSCEMLSYWKIVDSVSIGGVHFPAIITTREIYSSKCLLSGVFWEILEHKISRVSGHHVELTHCDVVD